VLTVLWVLQGRLVLLVQLDFAVLMVLVVLWVLQDHQVRLVL